MSSPRFTGMAVALSALSLGGCDARLSRWDRVRVQTDTPAAAAAAAAGAGAGQPSTPSPPAPVSGPAARPGDAGPAPAVDVGADVIADAAFVRTAAATDPLPMTYQWAQTSGPGRLTFTDSTALTTGLSAAADGAYVVELTATDSAGRRGSARFNLLWETSPPSAPTALTTTAGGAGGADLRDTNQTTVDFVWSGAVAKVSGVRDYTVSWYGAAGCAGSATVVAGVVATSYAVPAANGETLSFRVTALSRAGLSATSACSLPITINTVPPVDTMSLALATPSVGVVALTVTYGATLGYQTVELRRAPGATPPPCGSGTLVKTYAAPAFPGAPDTVSDDTGEAGQQFSYQLCIADRAGNITTGKTATVRTRPHIIFATSTLYDGRLAAPGGLPGADAACMAALATPGLALDVAVEATWAAVLSDDGVDARARVIVSGSVVAADGFTPLAAGHDDLWLINGIAAPPALIPPGVGLDERGVATTAPVWTGSGSSGLRVATTNCANWTVTGATGRSGRSDAAGFPWLDSATVACTQLAALYCISQPAPLLLAGFTAVAAAAGQISVTVTPPASPGKIDHIELYRAAGATPPDAGCSTGLIAALAPVTAAAMQFFDRPLVSGQRYSYRACAVDRFGNILASAAAANVAAP